jgi:SOS-response transcriptional repressor LexA
MAEVSRQLGRNPTYIQQFVTKGVPKEFDETDRRMLAAILKVSQDQLQGPGRPRRARNIFGETAQKRIHDLSWPPAPAMPNFAELPVFQAVREDSGAIVMSKRPSSKMLAPPMMSLGSRAYCIVVADDTMAPEHRAGSLAIVDPDLEVKPGTTCLFINVNGHANEVLLRHVRKETEDKWHVCAHNINGKVKEQVLIKAHYAAPHVTCGNIFRIL